MTERRLESWEHWPLDLVGILRALEAHRVSYVVVGGFAALVHGSPLPTYDLDLTPEPERKNLARLLAALEELGAVALPDETGDTAPKSVVQVLSERRDVSFSTPHGYLDLVHAPAGTRGYGDLARRAARLEIAPGVTATIAALRDVVRSKEVLGRERDLAQRAALRTLRELSR